MICNDYLWTFTVLQKWFLCKILNNEFVAVYFWEIVRLSVYKQYMKAFTDHKCDYHLRTQEALSNCQYFSNCFKEFIVLAKWNAVKVYICDQYIPSVALHRHNTVMRMLIKLRQSTFLVSNVSHLKKLGLSCLEGTLIRGG